MAQFQLPSLYQDNRVIDVITHGGDSVIFEVVEVGGEYEQRLKTRKQETRNSIISFVLEKVRGA